MISISLFFYPYPSRDIIITMKQEVVRNAQAAATSAARTPGLLFD